MDIQKELIGYTCTIGTFTLFEKPFKTQQSIGLTIKVTILIILIIISFFMSQNFRAIIHKREFECQDSANISEIVSIKFLGNTVI